MKYKFSLENIIVRRIPWRLRNENRVNWIKAMFVHLFDINSRFKAFVDEVEYKLNIRGQTIYLKHYLNDLYDNSQRRIELETNELPDFLFLFLKDEQRGFYMASLWKSTTSYSTNDVVNYKGINYLALAGSTNKAPDTSSSLWNEIGESYFMTDLDFIDKYDFTIIFPSTILIDAEFERKVRGLIDPYVVAGKKYNLINS